MNNSKIDECVILLGGLGTRCYPFSLVLPKCMMPVANVPVIEYIVNECQQSGIQKIFFVVPKGQNSKVCLQHFGKHKKLLQILKEKNSPYFDIVAKRKFPKIALVYCDEPNGSGGALMQCKNLLKSNFFAVCNGDDLFYGKQPALLQLFGTYQKIGASVVGCKKIPIEQNYKYGMIDCSQSKIKRICQIIEKPQNNNTLDHAVVGRYILNKNIFDYIAKTPKVGGEIYLTTAIAKMSQNDLVVCKTLRAKRFDCGTMHGLLQANNFFTKIAKK